MKISKRGKDLIHKYEQFRNNPYLCPAGVPTIGWGNTFYEDGTPVKMTDKPITRKRGDELNAFWLKEFEDVVNKYVKVRIAQYQFDALVSFVYNVGQYNFKNSTLLKRINNDALDPDIMYQFRRWNKGTVNGERVVLKGLTRRRNEEAYLYFNHCNN